MAISLAHHIVRNNPRERGETRTIALKNLVTTAERNKDG